MLMAPCGSGAGKLGCKGLQAFRAHAAVKLEITCLWDAGILRSPGHASWESVTAQLLLSTHLGLD